MFETVYVCRGFEPGQISKSFVENACESLALGNDVCCSLHLRGTQSALQIGHALVVAGIGVVGKQIGACSQMALQIGHGGAMIAQTTQLFGQGIALGGDHAAFTGGDRLARVKAETAGIT